MIDPASPKAPRRHPRPAFPLGAALGLLLATPSAALAEEAKTLPTVTYNYDLHAFEQVLPHRTPFNVQISSASIDTKYDTFLATYRERGSGACSDPIDPNDPNKPTILTGTAGEVADGKRKYLVQIPRLKYSTAYCFNFTISRKFGDKDKANIELAMVDTFKSSMEKGAYDRKQIHDYLVKALGKDASAQVNLVLPDKGQKPLIDLIESHFFDETHFTPSMSYADAHGKWLSYHDAEENLHRRIAELIKADPTKPDLLGKLAPPDLEELQAFQDKFKEVSAIARKLEMDKALTAEEASALLLQEPASIESMVKKLKQPLIVLHGQADTLQTKHCDAKDMLDNNRKKVCNDTIIAVFNATAEVSKHLDDMNVAQLDYAKLKSKVSEEIKGEVAGLQVAFPSFSSVTASITFTERSSFYVSADVGMIVPIFGGGGGADVAPFLGINVYFSAVDKEVSLPPIQDDLALSKRFSLTGGITLSAVRDSKKTVEGIVNGNAVIAGAGVRLTDYLRLGSGAVILRQSDENPVATTTKHVRATPYLALSIDVDVASIVTGSYAKFK